MRLFVAVVPPPAVLDHLAAVLSEVGTDDERVRWTLPEQWHLSLAFLGEVGDETLPELHRRLARAAARHRPLDLALAGAGAFGSVRRARVVWAGVTGDITALRNLAGSVTAAARRCGIEVEERRFRAHLTLGRLPEPADVSGFVERLRPYAGPSWTAERVELVRSHLGAGPGRRSRYETVAAWTLGRPKQRAGSDHGDPMHEEMPPDERAAGRRTDDPTDPG